jgi:hypothetical protein
MALHSKLPKSPYAVLLPDYCWFPAAEELRSTAYEKLLPPLVAKVRSGYEGCHNPATGIKLPDRSVLNGVFAHGRNALRC